jgi:3-isopropylmalate/(R)-2-methylmalate dehydratase large subunit
MAAQTLFEKIWNSHVVYQEPGGPALLYVDLHLLHDLVAAPIFDALRNAGRKLRAPGRTFTTLDHTLSTASRAMPSDPRAAALIRGAEAGCNEFGVPLFGLDSPYQGIVHVVGPEQGLSQPGMVIVCGDSHTATHGAMGALAFGVGASEVEHVAATQCIWQEQPRTMEVRVEGALAPGVAAKDLILGVIGQIGVAGGFGHAIEYRGPAISALSMEERMTVCNMTIEAGSRTGMVAPDQATIDYLRGRRYAPRGADFERAAAQWLTLASDPGARFDRSVTLDAARLAPQVTWGTNPGMVTDITGRVPSPNAYEDPAQREAAVRALEYMGLEPGTPITGIAIDRVFIGSCTNSRLHDLQQAARIVKGRKVNARVRAMVVPGSQWVKTQAETLGLDTIFRDAGFEWREAGCSMCLGVNDDLLAPKERCASTSNRNFEGRQGKDGRTHLASPAMAAAAAIAGHFVDVRTWS